MLPNYINNLYKIHTLRKERYKDVIGAVSFQKVLKGIVFSGPFFSVSALYLTIIEVIYAHIHSPSSNRNLISVSCFVCFSGEVLFRWIYNDFPNFIIPDQRRFVSQTTGNLYIAKVEASDIGNYSCFVSSPSIGKSVFSMPIPLLPQIESECCHITHNAKRFPHNCLPETTVVLKC